MGTGRDNPAKAKTGGVWDAIEPGVLSEGAPLSNPWAAQPAPAHAGRGTKLPPDLEAAIAAAAATRGTPSMPPLPRAAAPGALSEGPAGSARDKPSVAQEMTGDSRVTPAFVDYPADSPAMRLSPAFAEDLPASGMLAGARVTLGGVKDGRAERLLYDLTGTRILAKQSYEADEDTLVLTFDRADTVANYRHVLSSLRYLNRAEDATDGPRLALVEGFAEAGGSFLLGAVAVMVGNGPAAAGREPPSGSENGAAAFAFLRDEAADGRAARGPDAPAAERAGPAEAFESAAYTLVPDTGSSGDWGLTDGTGKPDAGAQSEIHGGTVVYWPDGAVALGGEHQVLGDMAGTRLLDVGLPGLPDGSAVYRVFEAGNDVGAEGTPPQAPAPDIAAAKGQVLIEFGFLNDPPLFDDGEAATLAAAPGAPAPKFESLLLSPPPPDEDGIDSAAHSVAA